MDREARQGFLEAHSVEEVPSQGRAFSSGRGSKTFEAAGGPLPNRSP